MSGSFAIARRRARVGGIVLSAVLLLAACRPAPEAPPAVLPGLADALPSLTTLTIEQGAERLILRRDGERWVIEGAGWRADRRRLQPLLLNLAQARCDEARTADPARFPRIGVEWPAAPAIAEGAAFAQPTGRLTLALDGVEARIVVGHPHPRGGTFVRVEGAAHSCLTRADLRLPSRAAEWFDPRVWEDVPAAPERVVVEDAGSTPLTLVREGTSYRAEGRAGASTPLADGLVAALLGLRQTGLRATADPVAPPSRVLRFDSPAGVPHAVALYREGEQTWARVIAAPAPGAAGFVGREFLLPPDVAGPLWFAREGLGATP